MQEGLPSIQLGDFSYEAHILNSLPIRHAHPRRVLWLFTFCYRISLLGRLWQSKLLTCLLRYRKVEQDSPHVCYQERPCCDRRVSVAHWFGPQ